MSEEEKRRRLPLMVRFSEEERALLDAEAKENGMATGAWIRATCVKVAKDAARQRKKDGG